MIITIAIDKSNLGFHKRWKYWLKERGANVLEVDLNSQDTLKLLRTSNGLMWHHWQTNTKHLIKAKRVLFALEHSSFPVFPNFKSNWHFDDKIGQMYLLEALDLPLVPSWHFVKRVEAEKWMTKQDFPIIFKLARGAGSANVVLVSNHREGRRMISQSFSKGLPVFDGLSVLKERYNRFKKGKENFVGLLKGCYHLVKPPLYSRYLGRSLGEVYFQEYIPNEGFDIRIIVVGDKAFAIKRLVREKDFRASGSGLIQYKKNNFKEDWIHSAFQWADKLNSQVVAFDIVVHKDTEQPYIVEISYGYAIDAYDDCTGYWNSKMEYFPGRFDSCEWMVDDFLSSIQKSR